MAQRNADVESDILAAFKEALAEIEFDTSEQTTNKGKYARVFASKESGVPRVIGALTPHQDGLRCYQIEIFGVWELIFWDDLSSGRRLYHFAATSSKNFWAEGMASEDEFKRLAKQLVQKLT